MGRMIAADAHPRARQSRRECPKRAAVSQEFCCARSVASTQSKFRETTFGQACRDALRIASDRLRLCGALKTKARTAGQSDTTDGRKQNLNGSRHEDCHEVR